MDFSSESRKGRHIFISVRIHLVFRIRQGFPTVREDLQSALWAYIGGIVKWLDLKLYQVGGARDHVHVFFRLPSTVTVSSVVQAVKAKSSAWIRQAAADGEVQ
jgi:REP-associated tyrosine transposase